MAALEKPEVEGNSVPRTDEQSSSFIEGQLTVDDCIAEAVKADPKVFTSVTPSGISVEYSPPPNRFYRVNGERVASVTTILDVLNKPLSWYGMKIGVEGVLELYNLGHLREVPGDGGDGLETLVHDRVSREVVGWFPSTQENTVEALTFARLTVNHKLKKAGDRGTNVHKALEEWCLYGTHPHPEIYPDSERGYIEGLVKFLHDFGPAFDIQTEVMVGSAKHKFAGRFDFGCRWGGGEMVTKIYPVRKPKREELPAGRWMLDAKTSSGVYDSHSLQLGGYKGANDECGYEPYDYSAVIHLTEDGQYELVVTTATLDDFLAVRSVYDVLQRKLTA